MKVEVRKKIKTLKAIKLREILQSLELDKHVLSEAVDAYNSEANEDISTVTLPSKIAYRDLKISIELSNITEEEFYTPKRGRKSSSVTKEQKEQATVTKIASVSGKKKASVA
jgi:hypothetical protein